MAYHVFSLQRCFKTITYYLWNPLRICVVLSSLEELALADKNRYLLYTNNQSYNSSHGISKGHIEFSYGDHIMEAEFGNLNMGTFLEEENNKQSSSFEHPSRDLKLGWREGQDNYLKKSRDTIIFSENNGLNQKNNENNYCKYIKIGWRCSWRAPLDQTFTFFASTHGELYQDQIFNRSLSEENGRGETSIFPKIGVDWSGPLIPVWQNNIIFQPSGKLISIPRQAIGSNVYPILGQDSESFGVHDVSGDNSDRFCADQFSENNGMNVGSCAFYGGKFLTTLEFLGNATLFLGQNYVLSKFNHQNSSERLSSPFSDYIGYIEATPLDWLMLEYRFRFDKKSLKHRVSKVGGTISYASASFSASYIVTHNLTSINDEKNFNKNNQQINLFFSSQFTNNWFFMSSVMQDFQKKQKKRGGGQYGVGAHYNGENFTFGLTVNRYFYPNMGLKPEITYMLTFGFNSAGEYISPTNLNQGEQGTSGHFSLRP